MADYRDVEKILGKRIRRGEVSVESLSFLQ